MCRFALRRLSFEVRLHMLPALRSIAQVQLLTTFRTLPSPVRSECPVETHAHIRRMVQTSCSRGNPSPPPAPSPTPRPPPPPKAPRPLAGSQGSLRLKAAETAQSPNCRPVTYAACLAASQEVGSHLRLSTNIEISLAACEAGISTGPCFIGTYDH